MADELIDILTEEGAHTGKSAMKSRAHANGWWHASAQIWIYTPQGEVLLQKRAACKDTYPNLWDISVAGHLSSGDTPIEAALREIEEEIGVITSAKALCYLKRLKKSKKPKAGLLDNEFNYLFIYCFPIDLASLKLQVEEVAEVQLVPLSKFAEMLRQSTELFVPHGMEYYNFIIKSIRIALAKEQK